VRPRISSPRVVARDAELATLSATLDRAVAGTPAVVLLAGEAGIGKSRLVREVERQAAARGMIVLRGDCVELDGAELPYAPVAAALRDAPAEIVADVLATLPREARAELAGAFPRLATGEAPSEAPAAGFSQGRLYEFLLQLLGALGAAQPVLLVVEDFHWVDRSTRDFVSVLVRTLRSERIAVLLSYRTGELEPAHPVRQAVSGLRLLDRVTWVDLEPLPAAAVGAQLGAILGESPAPELVAEVHARSGGNPFFAEELLVARLEAGRRVLPASLTDALLVRLRRLSAPAQHTLRCVAVVGHPVDHGLLATVSAVAEPELSRALHAALDHHLLVHRRAEGTFAFRHDVVREAVYYELLPGERAAVHAEVARTLAGAPGEPRHAELAFHWREAGLHADALRASIEAGVQAEAARAFAEALRLYEQALGLWDAVDTPAALVLDRIEVLGRACDLARFTGDYERATELCRDALRRLDEATDPARCAAFYERLGRLQSFAGDSGLHAYQQALRLLPAGGAVARARLLSAEGYALWGLMRWDEAARRCEEALGLATQAGALEEAANARMVLGLAAAHAGDPERGEGHLREALRGPLDRIRPDDLLYGHVFLGEVLRLQGRFDTAAEVMDQGSRHARRLGMEGSFGGFTQLNAACDLYLLGRWQEAETRVADMAGAPLEPWDALVLRQVAGQLRLARGDLDGAAAELEQARTLCDGAPPECVPAVYAALGELALWHGELAAARAHVAEGMRALGDRADVLYAPALFSTGARVEAEIAAAAAPLGARDAAEAARATAARLLADLEHVLDERAPRHRPPTAVAHVLLTRGEQARAAGRADPALWAQAASAWDAVRAPYPAAYARWRQAEAALLGEGDRPRAAQVLGEAHVQASRLGAACLQAEIEGLARRARIPLAAEPPTRARIPDMAGEESFGLTERELEVLALVGEGMTNRQIGERLFISPKTAGLHVSHILAKLNVGNRTQAADVAHRHGLVQGSPAVPS